MLRPAIFICQLFERLGCPVFKWHSNTRPFGIQPIFNHFNTKLVGYSNPHCSELFGLVYGEILALGYSRVRHSETLREILGMIGLFNLKRNITIRFLSDCFFNQYLECPAPKRWVKYATHRCAV